MAEMTITAHDITEALRKSLDDWNPSISRETVGHVSSIADGVAKVKGLPLAMSSELLEFEGGLLGVVLDLEEDSIGVVMMGDSNHVEEGDPVRQTSRVLEIGVG
ncbi:MAG: F0F1 ATP synthase subunit alpha, partial [Acidimicrobiia bacterium]|nr:F0F1 ATP synthase subunit alpha [Acidimicrobiia bacterium]